MREVVISKLPYRHCESLVYKLVAISFVTIYTIILSLIIHPRIMGLPRFARNDDVTLWDYHASLVMTMLLYYQKIKFYLQYSKTI